MSQTVHEDQTAGKDAGVGGGGKLADDNNPDVIGLGNQVDDDERSHADAGGITLDEGGGAAATLEDDATGASFVGGYNDAVPVRIQ